MSPGRKRLFWVLSVVLILALAEAGTRIVMRARGIPLSRWIPGTVLAGEPHPTVLYQSHPFLPYALRPSLDVRSIAMRSRDGAGRRIDVRSNAWGGRGEEIELPKPAGTLRIAALGGSTTFGQTRLEDAWTTRLGELLRRRLPADGPRIEVLNFGTPKATSVYSLVSLATRVVHLDPDVVIVYHGVNDVSNWRFRGLRPDHAHVAADLRPIPEWVERVPSWAFRSAVITATVYGLAQRHERGFGERSDLVLAPDWQRDQVPRGIEILLANYRSMHGLCEAHGARFVTATFHLRDEGGPWGAAIRALNRELRSWAAAEGIPLADLAAEIPHGNHGLHSDAAHFTPAGHRRVAEVLAETLLQDVLPVGAPSGSQSIGES